AESRRSDHKTPSSGKTFSVQPFRRLGPVIAGVDERSFTEELRATMGRLPRAHVSLVQPPARADVMVNGTIQQSEDGIRVIVTMSDAKTQAQIWSETYMRPAARREGMAVAVAHQVMREVARRFLPPPRREPLLRTTKVSVKAIGLYKRARMLHSRSQAYDWMRTKELYEAAIREEPRFAEAWSGLSDVWIMQALMFTSSDSA